jgi:hypothetical protein
VVLERPDEHHRPLPRRDALQQPIPLGQAGRQPQLEDADQLVDRGGGAGATEDHHVVVGATDGVADQPAGVLAQPRRLQSGTRAFGVRVGVAGQHLVADEVLDEVQRPPGCGVVGVGDPARPVRPVEHLAVPDDPRPDPLQQR